jgi:hypothetical protein
MQDIKKVEDPLFKDMPNDKPVCSLIQANWTDPVSSLSTNPECYCPVGNKASNTINNIKLYKCQIPYPNPV